MYNWAQFKNAVKELASDISVSDTTATAAAAMYVRAQAARDLIGNGDLYTNCYSNYLGMRKNLLGYTITLDDTTLRSNVRDLISDSVRGETTAVKAAAAYVMANMERSFFGNIEAQKAHLAEYASLKGSLLGYSIVMNNTALRTEVNKLITDTTRSETTAIMAAAYWLDANIARQKEGDEARYNAAYQNYLIQKRKLIGYSITSNDATIKAEAVKFLSDVAPSDDTYVRAIADYTKAFAARDLSGNLEAFNSNYLAYRNQRRKLMGYTTALTDSQVKTKVKELITDLTAGETTATLAVSYFIKAHIAREAQHDQNEYESYWKRYLEQKARLLGYTITSNAATLRAAVDKLITVDADRSPLSDSAGYIDKLIEQAQTDISSLDTFIDRTCLQAKADILAFNDFITENITQAKADIAGMNEVIDTLIAQARNDIIGLETYFNSWIAQAKADIAGSATFIDNIIRQAVIELQEYIPVYREGHETIFNADDVSQEGGASVGMMPDQAEIQDIYFVTVGNPCVRGPVFLYNWGNRYDLVCGNPRSTGSNSFIAIDPQSKQFMVYPKLDDSHYLSMFWDGTKLEFEDEDETPFDEGMVGAVADYLQAELARRAPVRDFKLAQTYMATYASKRTQLYLKGRNRVSIKQNNFSKVMLESSTCASEPDTTEIEVVLFGDSGEEPLDNTTAVANLAIGLDPDLIIHLGDTNYPSGAVDAYQDHFTRYFSSFIQEEAFYQAWGNHDLEVAEDGQYGKPLLNLLPHIADLNDGKLYYQFTHGPVNFFVLNSGYSDGDPREPDGISSSDTQAEWLESALSAASSGFNVVILHRPPYCSDANYTPGSSTLQWPFKDWGADLVISAHGHNYERLLVGGLSYLVAGLGGATKRSFGASATGSQFRYNSQHGVIRLAASSTRLQAVFFNVSNEIVDSLTIHK